MNKDKQYDISYLRFQKDRNWRDFLKCKSTLEQTLDVLSKKTEDELTKRDLLYLISCNCDYMRSLNLYNYYKDELTKALVSKQDEMEYE